MSGRSDYGARTSPDRGVVASVAPGSPAQKAGVVVGERVHAVDGHAVHDVLDWRWYADGSSHRVDLSDSENPDAVRTIQLDREPGEPWGIEFSAPLFDRIRVCRNECAFCFMSQLPQGLRSTLYLRDDDFRLSFLQGNFITLTNLSERDMERIVIQRLSPLYVSLHAVDPDVRAALVNCRDDDRALERFDRLLEEGIDLHVQIVLVPGINDGAVLDRTLTWLAEREGVASVGIVPLGFTRHQDRFEGSYDDQDAARAVVAQVTPWQEAMRERDGISWVHVADEFYIVSGATLPIAEHYDGFPQYENGIGIVRSFVDDVIELRSDYLEAMAALPRDVEDVTIVTGQLAASTLAGALEACGGVGRVRILVVPNAYLGGNVTCAGLLAGADLSAAISDDGHGGTYLIPEIAFNADGLSIDDWQVSRIVSETGARIIACASDARGLLEGLRSAAQ